MLRALDPQVAAPLHSLLRPSGGGTGAAGLLVSAVELSGLLGLQLPNLNGPLLLYKAARELALPEVRAPPAAPRNAARQQQRRSCSGC